jgi:hypothetical protein
MLYYPLVIKAEETVLEEKHGEKFHDYFASTPSFFPKLSKFSEPDTYTMNPKIFRSDLFQALWFIWAIGILEIVEELHSLEIIPKFFNLY